MSAARPRPATLPPLRIRCDTTIDRVACGTAVAHWCVATGLDRHAAWKLGLSAMELVQNAVRHGGGDAHLTCRVVPERDGRRAEIVCEDAGHGVVSAELTRRDGDSRGVQREKGTPVPRGVGLGIGLGAVHRLVDSVEIVSGPGRGTRVVLSTWIP